MDQTRKERVIKGTLKLIEAILLERDDGLTVLSKVLALVTYPQTVLTATEAMAQIEQSSRVVKPEIESDGDGGILVAKGYKAHCWSCNTTVYEVTADIKARGVGIGKFLRSFQPVKHSRMLTREDLDVQKDQEGNTYIDCTVCRGLKSLQIAGKPTKPVVERGQQPEVNAGTSVGSVGSGDLGGI